MCRGECDAARQVPPITDVGRWFDALDLGSGKLSKEALVDACAATYPLKRSTLEDILNLCEWNWDRDIDKHNFLRHVAPWISGASPLSKVGLLQVLLPKLDEQDILHALEAFEGDDKKALSFLRQN
jgi:hypothetical protein